MRFDTRAARATDPIGKGEQPLTPSISLASEYAYDDLDQYSESIAGRAGNAFVRGAGPTSRQLHATLASLEGAAAAWAFPGGMAAIRAVFSALVPPGSHVIAQRTLYGGTAELLREVASNGSAVSRVAPRAAEVEDAFRPDTRLVFLEGMANPTLEVAEVTAIAEVCTARGAILVVDNSLATPVLQRPAEHGSGVIIVHSTTKYLSGHSDVVGGAVIGPVDTIATMEAEYLRAGSHTSAFDAFLVLRGLSTLSVRVRRQCATAFELALLLADHPAVETVTYPGLPDSPSHATARAEFEDGLFGPMLSFCLAGSYRDAVALSRRLRVIRVISSFGGPRTGLCHPASTSHRQLSPDELSRAEINPNLLRLAVGLEDPADLAEDLDSALRARHGSRR